MASARKIFKNACSNGTAFAVEAITAFAMMPFVVHRIGDSAYGIWVLISALSGYMGLFKLGFRPSINKHVAQYKALNQIDRLREFIGASLLVFSFVVFAIAIAGVVISYYLPQIIKIEPQYVDVTRILVLFAAAQTATSMLGTVYGGAISGYQRYEVNAGIEICVILIRAALIVIFLPKFSSLYTVAAAHFSITILGYFVTIYWGRKIVPIKKLKIFHKPPKDIVDTIIKFNSISFLIGGIGILVMYADSFIVGILLSSAVITHYAVGGRLVKYTTDLLRVTTRVIAPAISELNATDDQEGIKRVVEYTTRIACAVAFPILICLIIQGQEFIILWMGHGYEDSYKILLYLAIAGLVIIPQEVMTPLLYGLARHKFLLYLMLIEGVVAIPLSYILGSEYGIQGIAIGLVAPRAVLRGMIFPVFVARKVGLRLKEWLVNSYVRIGISILPFAIMLYIFKYFDLISSWLLFIAQLALSLVVYAISLMLVGVNSIEREYVINAVRKRLF